jgi:hypothetical protein
MKQYFYIQALYSDNTPKGERKMKRQITYVLLAACLIVFGATSQAPAPDEHSGHKAEGSAKKAGAKSAAKLKPQETCPIMGGKIDKKQFVDVAGYRIYTCCPACNAKIKANPAKALATLKAKGEKPEALPKLKAQTTCPVMGGKIDKKQFVDAGAYRIYLCCPACESKVKKDPAKAIATLAAKGERPEVRLAVCSKCGELKGTTKCCAEDAKKCEKCGLNKGAPGCCNKGVKKIDALLCTSCGEIKGSAACCAKDAKKCDKCGLAKGSPGCCKIPESVIKAAKK